MVYAAWSTTMLKPDKEAGEGATVADGYRVAADNPRHLSHDLATRILRGPPLPESIEYLWEWAVDIRRGLGVGINGLNEMTWLVIDAWARLRGIVLERFEEDVLLKLDAVMRNPESIGDAAWT